MLFGNTFVPLQPIRAVQVWELNILILSRIDIDNWKARRASFTRQAGLWEGILPDSHSRTSRAQCGTLHSKRQGGFHWRIWTGRGNARLHHQVLPKLRRGMARLCFRLQEGREAAADIRCCGWHKLISEGVADIPGLGFPPFIFLGFCRFSPFSRILLKA